MHPSIYNVTRFSMYLPVAAGMLCALCLVGGCTGAPLPARLGELSLVREISGDAGQQMIDRLHGKGVTPRESFIGFYEGEGSRATLYVSGYDDPNDALDVDRKMAGRIRAGNAVFGGYRERNIDGQQVSECVGMQQVHFFFSSGNSLYWLGVDPPIAWGTLISLLDGVGGGG